MNRMEYKSVYFIENDCTISKLLLKDSFNNDKKKIIVSLNYLVSYKLERHGVDYLMPDDIFTKNDYYNLHKKTDCFEKSWYANSENIDYSFFNGVSFGDVTSGMPSRSFFAVIIVYYTQLLNKVKNKYSNVSVIFHDLYNEANYFSFPDSDYLKFFQKRELFESSARQLLLSICYLHPKDPIPSAHLTNKKSNVNYLKVAAKKIVYFAVNTLGIIKRNKERSSRVFIPLYSNQKSFASLNLDNTIVENIPLSFFIKDPSLFLSGILVKSIDNIDTFKDADIGFNLFIKKMKKNVLSLEAEEGFSYKGIDYRYLY